MTWDDVEIEGATPCILCQPVIEQGQRSGKLIRVFYTTPAFRLHYREIGFPRSKARPVVPPFRGLGGRSRRLAGVGQVAGRSGWRARHYPWPSLSGQNGHTGPGEFSHRGTRPSINTLNVPSALANMTEGWEGAKNQCSKLVPGV